jgi:biotin operon repressor
MSQAQQILAHLKRRKRINPAQAYEKFGCFRLAARIAELRRKGHRIETAKEKGKQYATYRLA